MMKKQLIIQIGIFALAIGLTSALWRRPVVLTICLAVLAVIQIYKSHTKSDLAFYFVPFFVGPVAEGIAIYFGAWQYSKPLYLIPIWLPPLWGITALFIKKIIEIILRTDRISDLGAL
jgi:uncharacterized membrane protein YoaT (DUF817 family)